MRNTIGIVKTVTVRLPESLAAAIDSEGRRRQISKSDVVRERLEAGAGYVTADPLDRITDLIGSIDRAARRSERPQEAISERQRLWAETPSLTLERPERFERLKRPERFERLERFERSVVV